MLHWQVNRSAGCGAVNKTCCLVADYADYYNQRKPAGACIHPGKIQSVTNFRNNLELEILNFLIILLKQKNF